MFAKEGLGIVIMLFLLSLFIIAGILFVLAGFKFFNESKTQIGLTRYKYIFWGLCTIYGGVGMLLITTFISEVLIQ